MTPYPHQRAAVDAVASALVASDRCRVTMACGTGKTETAAWSCVGVGTREVTARIVVGLPSLNLVDQTWRRWAGMFQMPPAMAVCSDEKVGREVFRVADYGLPRSSTDPGEIARFLATGGPCVVFCTYQSAERLAEAMDAPGVPPFDFAICDEAHRLTGKGSQGAAFLDNGRIRATRRTFWTATPRIVRGDDVISMDDPKQFGVPVFTYSFGDAIRDGRLSQFQIVAVQVDDPRVSDALASDKGVEDAAVVVAVAKAMREHGLRRVISFHSLVARAAAFAEALPKVCASLPDEHRLEGVYANHIHAGTPMDVRRSELARLRSAVGWTLLSNARCLGEGVDVPELDGIVFADPRTSEIEIWQAIGRAIRKSGEGKVATVLIPVFIPKGMDAEQAIEGGRFRPVFSVLKAMQAHDPSMSEVIVNWSERAKSSGMAEAKDAEPLRFMFHGSASMAAALSAVVVGRTDPDGHRFRTVRGSWPNLSHSDAMWVTEVRASRAGRGKLTLTPERVAFLESLPGFEWDPVAATRAATIRGIVAAWPNTTRQMNVTISTLRAIRGEDPSTDAVLEALPGWSWDPVGDAFRARIESIKSQWPALDSENRRWLSGMKSRIKNGKIHDPEKIQEVARFIPSTIPAKEAAWWSRARDMMARWPNSLTEPEKAVLANWRAKCRAGKFPQDRAAFLESWPEWEWSPTLKGRKWKEDAERIARHREGLSRAHNAKNDGLWFSRLADICGRWPNITKRDNVWIAEARRYARGGGAMPMPANRKAAIAASPLAHLVLAAEPDNRVSDAGTIAGDPAVA